MSEENKISWPGWETGKLLGRGSFGAVYEIQRNVFDDVEKAALKVISIPQNESDLDEMYSDGYDEESITSTFQSHLKSIVAEYSLMRKMNGCSNIVSCDDIRYVQHDDGIGWDIFIKMELLTPLTKALPAEIPEEMVVKIAKDLCAALELCKKHEIVHRDIKPQNIFVSDNGDYKLGDFGIAKTVEKTMGGTKIGTYKYMAPEVYNNQPYGSAADIYSLGLVLYWLLNERRMPFLPLPPAKLKAGMDEEARARRLSGEQIPAPAHGSEELKAIVLKACAYDVKDRYTSAHEMLEALNALGGVAPVVLPIVESAQSEPDSVGEMDGTVTVGPVWIKKEEAQSDLTEDGTQGPVFAPRGESSSTSATDPKTKYQIRFLDNDGNLLASKTYKPGQHVYAPDVQPKKIDGVKCKFQCWEPEFSDIAKGSVDYKAVYEVPAAAAVPVRKQKKGILIGIAAVACALLLVCGIPAILDATKNPPVNDSGSAGNSGNTGNTGNSGSSTENKYPQQLQWSGWSETLPSYVSEANYLIEKQTLYRSRELETTSSTTSSTMSGWEHYDTVSGNGGFGNWSDWSATAVSATNTRQVETQTRYRYRTKQTTTSSSSTKSGWTLYDTTYAWGDYGSWSSWSTSAVSSSTSRKVESKTQYRYRSITTSNQYSSWGSWSAWQDDAVSATDLKSVETRTGYYYSYFVCSNCGAHMHGYGTCYSWAGGCGKATVYQSSYRAVRSGTPYSSSADFYGTGVRYINDSAYGRVFAYTSSSSPYYVSPITQYRYRTRTVSQVKNYGNWSSWSDTAVSSSSSRQVETRKVYRYCDRSQVATYHFYKWGDWSSWSTTAASATSNKQVETSKFYRYREQVKTTTYYFRRWKSWSGYSTAQVSPSSTVQVETKDQYRFKSK